MTEIPELGTTKFTDLLLGFTTAEDLETLIITVLSHPGGTAKAVYGEATNFEAPRESATAAAALSDLPVILDRVFLVVVYYCRTYVCFRLLSTKL